jgi:RNA polymerase sigma factor (sigma-70 family)
LAARYFDLIYSTALRLVHGNTHQAQDIAQIVLTDLANLARKLSRKTMLGGWLHRHTCFVALNALRTERRRQARERQAVEMNTLTDDTNLAFTHVAPVLDETINELRESDRVAILLRFFERRDLRSVGEALGSSENAAQKRVERALEQLRARLTRRGITLSVGMLGAAMSTCAVTASPAGLALQLSVAALAPAAAGSGITVTFLKLMSMTQLKLATIGVLVTAAIAVPVTIQTQTIAKLQQENTALRKQQDLMGELAAENKSLSKLPTEMNDFRKITSDEVSELLKLRGEVGLLRQQKNELARLQEENRQLRAAPNLGQANASFQKQSSASPQEEARMTCVNHLRQIDGASQQCALENKLSAKDVVAREQILPYLKNGDETLRCPSGGTYTFGSLTNAPVCSFPGHMIPTN